MTVRVARLTPNGTGGVASIAVVGESAWLILRDLFQTSKGRSLVDPPAPGSLTFGRFGEPPGDDVVLAVRPGVPTPWYEIHCHGGIVVVEWLMEQLATRGATIVPWADLERIAAGSWVRAAAAVELANALTTKQAAILLDQVNGALENEIRAILPLLEDGNLESATDQLCSIVLRGATWTKPWRVALVGPPNVGKSSLINAVAGFERVVVAPQAGTTRENVATLVALDGWPVELHDTAGVESPEQFRRQVMQTYDGNEIVSWDYWLWVMDRSIAPEYPPDGPVPNLILVNKADLPAVWDANTLSIPHLLVSAKTGLNVDRLGPTIIEELIPKVQVGAGVMFDAATATLLSAALAACGNGKPDAAKRHLLAMLQPEPPANPFASASLDETPANTAEVEHSSGC